MDKSNFVLPSTEPLLTESPYELLIPSQLLQHWAGVAPDCRLRNQQRFTIVLFEHDPLVLPPMEFYLNYLHQYLNGHSGKRS